MNINMETNLGNYKQVKALSQQQRNAAAVASILNSNKSVKIVRNADSSKRDCYISSIPNNNGDDTITIPGKATAEMLDRINFDFGSCISTTDSFIIDGIEIKKSELPDIPEDRGLEIKAENNNIVFEMGKYYKFCDEKGKTHIINCSNNHLTTLNTDTARKVIDAEGLGVGKFWSMMAKDGTYTSLYWSEEWQKKQLNDAGITEGFFSVQLGDYRQEYFYSNGRAGIAVSKKQYDSSYHLLTGGIGCLDEYEIGSVFKIGETEYVLSADKKLDIPYGADIFTIQYPKIYTIGK